jgi:hypothetical protein
MAAALQALALTESAPALVPCYPPSAAAIEQLRPIVLGAIREHQSAIHAFLSSPPQTNEVGRSGVLVGGFLQIAQDTRLPLRLLEIGASAGLNAIWDRYHYRLGAAGWGDPQSAVRIAPSWQGPSPPIDAPIRVIERLACDIAPIDLEDPTQRLRLRAYVWADQNAFLVWKAPSSSRAPTAQELSGPTLPLGSEQNYTSQPRRARPSSTIPSCGSICRPRPKRISGRASRTPAVVRPAPHRWPGCASSR